MYSFEKLTEIFSVVLNTDINEITMELEISNCRNWDSLATVILINCIEQEFGVQFNIHEYESLISIRAFEEKIKNKII